MKKFFCIAMALLFSSFSFCTKDSPTQVSDKGFYTDSITLDLFTYDVFTFQHYKSYYGAVTITPKGQAKVQPFDPSLKSYDTNTFSSVIAPKYVPNQFEAWVYDTLPLIQTDETDPEVLVKSYSFSMNYFYRLDTVSSANIDKKIKPVDMSYIYGYGFVIRDPIVGTGKLKIYYK